MGNCCTLFLTRCGCKDAPRPPNRKIYVGQVDLTNKLYPNNVMISYKYTALNFIFKNLFEQFQRIANFYFLCIAIIQLFIDTPVDPATSIVPLLFVLSVTAIKQGREDVFRHRADREVNDRIFNIYRSNRLVEMKSSDINVGDLVLCKKDDPFPCDLIMLSSSEPSGECYVTTASLDGETNLKVFRSISDTRHLTTGETIMAEKIIINSPEPIVDLYTFSGRIETDSTKDEGWARPLNVQNILLNGARLKETEFIFGCAIYTGYDTKLSLNSKAKSHKFSQVEHKLNYLLIIYLILLGVQSIVLTALKYGLDLEQNAWYIPHQTTTPWVVVQDLLGYIVLLNYLIPISLYVTIELQKGFGSWFFGWDLELCDPISRNNARANTSDLNEELGQIEYLFSDKTGTLTQNQMKFQRCSAAGVKYIDDPMEQCFRYEMDGDGQNDKVEHISEELEEMLRVLVLCHTARAVKGEKEGNSEFKYQASSPDEVAFLELCQRHDIVFEGDDKDTRIVNFRGVEERYHIHQILEFDSDRKCMSIIVEYEDGSFHLHCKGAESTLISKVHQGSVFTDVTMNHVMDFALLGLRTLVIGTRQLTQQEAKTFVKNLEEAKMFSNENEDKLEFQNGQTDPVSNAYAEVESNLRLLGCTAVEDQLQDGVPETLRDLVKAEIKVWVLTGDKEETAVNISYSAGHFNPNLQIVRLTKITTLQQCKRIIDSELERIDSAKDNNNNLKVEYGLVMDGQSLVYALTIFIIPSLMSLIQKCSTVLCCRMTPLQKAEIVTMVREHIKPQPITAAIGDGANDVSMIREAHVGFGLFGYEGRQAVRASDYAFTYFCHLRKVLLVHGHWYYHRIAVLVQYFFYKNMAFITAQFIFSFFTAYSAQAIYHDYYLMTYNMIFTSLPILLFGLVEQPFNKKTLFAQPELYVSLRKNSLLSWYNFIRWNIFGIWHSLVTYFGIHLMITYNDVLSPQGIGIDIFGVGILLFTLVVTTVSLKLLLVIYHFSIAVLIGLVITAVGNLVILLLISGIFTGSDELNMLAMYWNYYHVWGLATSWLSLILLIFIALTPDIIYRYWTDIKVNKIAENYLKNVRQAEKINGQENKSFEYSY